MAQYLWRTYEAASEEWGGSGVEGVLEKGRTNAPQVSAWSVT
jgi:hypothetical protein